jgi:antitoxin ParD1/3/4
MAISADIGKQMEKFVTSLVSSGRYNSKSEVLREGIRLVQEREARLAVLDGAIVLGLEDVKAGRVTTAEDVFVRLEARFGNLAKSST